MGGNNRSPGNCTTGVRPIIRREYLRLSTPVYGSGSKPQRNESEAIALALVPSAAFAFTCSRYIPHGTRVPVRDCRFHASDCTPAASSPGCRIATSRPARLRMLIVTLAAEARLRVICAPEAVGAEATVISVGAAVALVLKVNVKALARCAPAADLAPVVPIENCI